ncbi:hypothetical protein EDB92DRAFT_265245 [Lactarius akahatsu]|uniref:Transmembrane protein n=1 Tax=Lactarius akahatsu TaxID=416441 RepID=A0AAD4L5D7_9AGAM|nr:hypothetical protein EDB92DRAFT_265245 [Lactarius akahatsu]
MGHSSMTPCCRFARSLVPLVLSFLSPSVAFYFFVYISIGLSFATPNRCNNISLFSAPSVFVILLVRACAQLDPALPRHQVRLWDKMHRTPEDQSLYLSSNLFARNLVSQCFSPWRLPPLPPSQKEGTSGTIVRPSWPSGESDREGETTERQKGEIGHAGHTPTPTLKCRLTPNYTMLLLFPFL